MLFPRLSTAQINESDTLDLKASLSLTGVFQRGNVETTIFRAKSELSVKTFQNWVFKTQNSYVYQEFGRKKADEDILSLNFLYFNPNRKAYPLILGFASTNYRREIDLRYLLGAGMTYQVVNTDHHWLKFSLSGEYERTRFSRPDFNFDEYNGMSSIATFRGTFWANGKYQFLNKKLVLNHEVYFQPSLEDRRNYRWQADLGLEWPLIRYLNFKINYVHTFESIVIASQKEEDSLLTFGFTIKSF